jgi:hypothetical protein
VNDSPRWLDKTITTIKKAGEAARDGVQHAYHFGTLKLDLASLRRTHDDVVKDLGRSAVDALRERGTLTSEQVRPLLGRLEELEKQIAEKERQVADLESELPPDTAPQDETVATRRRPQF